MADEPEEAVDPDFAAAGNIPAYFVDHCFVASGPEVLRLTFGEMIPGSGSMYRAAVTMTLGSARDLQAVLNSVLKESDEGLAGEAAPSKDGP